MARENFAYVKALILVTALGAAVYTAHILGLGGTLAGFRNFIRDLGFWGPAVFVLIYAAAVTALVPGSAMTIAAGVLFGTTRGIVTVSVASTLGAALSFLIARYFLRELVEKWLKKNEQFTKLDNLTEKQGAIIVAITRLVPLFPFTLLNYGFGLTKARFGTYIFWSWLCMLPGTVLYVAGSDVIFKLIANGKIPFGPAMAFTVFGVLLIILVKYAKAYLKKKEGKRESI